MSGLVPHPSPLPPGRLEHGPQQRPIPQDRSRLDGGQPTVAPGRNVRSRERTKLPTRYLSIPGQRGQP